jgi:ornithine cyclodeaminase
VTARVQTRRAPRPSNDILVVRGDDTLEVLRGQERELIDIVRAAYVAHAEARTSVPHSVFLTLPDSARRIIALPAYIDSGEPVAGVKWISSFPENVWTGAERASAVILLNSLEDGRVTTLVEGSVVSARRTAASAALAVAELHAGGRARRLGLVGCGRINLEVARFVRALANGGKCPAIVLHDLVHERADALRQRLDTGDGQLETANDLNAVLEGCDVISFATTATTPHADDVTRCAPGTTILHISLRDLEPAALARLDNVVDDTDHVCRAATSLHLAEQQLGHRDFVRCELGDVLVGAAAPRSGADVTVFSPFGLGILDVAVAQFVETRARAAGLGLRVEGFRPEAMAV